MDHKLLAGIASDLNLVPTSAAQAAEHAALVELINRKAADAAVSRLGVDRPPVTWETLRAAHQPAKAGAK